jgi:hypothetical protein
LSTLPEQLADLQIYRALFKRVLTNPLYFLEIVADEQIFHRIGVTWGKSSEDTVGKCNTKP